ncbi:TPA: hypothetical protein JD203_03725 [Cronobacter sakazakii]|uniref:hypothetical protein n=1 Tax=Enterobacteriaceae TaxID=543 RepID=UPI00097871C9|nr:MULTISPECIES: hypothetical protein [Enterobacteriaceae]EJO9548343.1 hypothetical protein [Cronobacter sakazakii]ELY4089626.1 hypothetical protein [Cronobacter sakazakii]EME1703224.1 hypothetical protein [Cronobacter sakazakii]KAB0871674.1 hypothetical protein FZI03_11880 [Cronobacter sakazakii]MCT9829178.1 hypothetical protein [Escherichia coli]
MSFYHWIIAAYLAAGIGFTITTAVQLKTGWRLSDGVKAELNDIKIRLGNLPESMRPLIAFVLTVLAIGFSAAVILAWPLMLLKINRKQA